MSFLLYELTNTELCRVYEDNNSDIGPAAQLQAGAIFPRRAAEHPCGLYPGKYYEWAGPRGNSKDNTSVIDFLDELTL